MSEAIVVMQDAIRERLKKLSPDARGAMWRKVGIQETHFYAFIRANSSRHQWLSAANLDPICEMLGVKFVVAIQD
jgi:hypothetical protein